MTTIATLTAEPFTVYGDQKRRNVRNLLLPAKPELGVYIRVSLLQTAAGDVYGGVEVTGTPERIAQFAKSLKKYTK